VKELQLERPPVDEKNIRRRVYDALNVLMAMDIIIKEKKDIRWKGFHMQNPVDTIEALEVLLFNTLSS
jgi:hypothetical protein